MPPLDHMIHVYRELAEREAERGAMQMRDRFLLLAADAALSAGQTEEAEQIRKQLVEANPHHLIRPYETFAEAMKAPEVYSYLVDLRDTYSTDEAEQKLQALRDGEPGDEPGEKPIRHVATNGPAPAKPEIYPLIPVREEKKPRVTALPTETAEPAPARMAAEPEDEDAPSFLNIWVPTGLFVILLAALLALAAYTFARPFMRF